jgi:hypothetical protein
MEKKTDNNRLSSIRFKLVMLIGFTVNVGYKQRE